MRELRGACVQHTMWLCVKIGGEDKRGETAGKCHFEHFQAWIPACSRTAALLHQWRGIGTAGRGYNEVLALEVRNVVDCIEQRRHA